MSWEFGVGTIEIDYEAPTDVAPTDYPDDEPMPMPMVALAGPGDVRLTEFKPLVPDGSGRGAAEFLIDFEGVYDSVFIRLSDDVPVIRHWFRWAGGLWGQYVTPSDVVRVWVRL